VYTQTVSKETEAHTRRSETHARMAYAIRPGASASKKTAPDIVPIGYLRAFATLLVLAHHAVLAYHASAPPQATSLLLEPRWWQAFPVVDVARSDLVALFAGWNDIFVMALMFFLSGLFVSASIERHGTRAFLGRRFKRLGLPFIALAAVIVPLAYYPAYLRTATPDGIVGYVQDWLALGNWPAGPGWFLWLLLVFDAAAVGMVALWPGWVASLTRPVSWMMARPVRCFAAFVAMTALVYLPLASIVSPLEWTAVGPFSFQTSRLFFYAVYFFGGVVLGAQGLHRGLFSHNGRLARRWPLWIALALVAYGFTVTAAMAAFRGGAGPVETAASLGFVFTSAASCFAFLGLFVRFARTPRPVFDSLRSNAYGMYVVHYAIVSWLQLTLLPVSIPALGKATLVIVATVLLSWATTAALRRVPAVRRVI
jgi:hypothetical protein